VDGERRFSYRQLAERSWRLANALPKTSTGKIQKFVLRDREWAGQDARIGRA
jgi:fatty-acyl-CoA synthase